MEHAAQVLLGVISVLAAAGDGGGSAAPPGPEEPLLVVVERVHGATTNPDQVRRAIAEELKRPVVGPTDLAGRSAAQILVVTIAPDSVAMQLRAAGDAAARRRIEPLANGDSGLRVIAWLAGNLARDQAGELMDALPGAAFAASETAPVAGKRAPRQASPAPAPAPAAVATNAPAAGEAPQEEDHAPWRLGLSVGLFTRLFGDPNVYSVVFERFEVLAPSRPGKWASRLALDIGAISYCCRSVVMWGGVNRRFTLVPRWLAADVGASGGLVLSRFAETEGTYVAGEVGGGLAFVRLPFGEVVGAARLTSRLDRWFAFSIGLNLALQ